MGQIVTYGLGGYCENCDETHDHPLHNITSVIDIPDDPVPEDPRIQILIDLGMTEEQARAILGL